MMVLRLHLYIMITVPIRPVKNKGYDRTRLKFKISKQK